MKSHLPVRCGIVLAAGDGRRLRAFVHRLRRDYLPKQYVSFVGRHSLLERTFKRAERLIAPERLFTVVAKDHLSFTEVRQQLGNRPRDRIVVQPHNRDTAPGVLLPLAHLAKDYPNATVVLLPSDHFVLQEDRFVTHIDAAFRAVEQDPSRVVLLGIEPDSAETEYGYIQLSKHFQKLAPQGFKEVDRFVEKPDLPRARQLFLEGALWNTMVVVFKPETFLAQVQALDVTLFRFFRAVKKNIGSTREKATLEQIYQAIGPVNFSRHLIQKFTPSLLWARPIADVRWSDWGSPRRVLNGVTKTWLFKPREPVLQRRSQLRTRVPQVTASPGPRYSTLGRSREATPSVTSMVELPDILAADTYLANVRRNYYLEPEKKLMLAILKDAVQLFQKYAAVKHGPGRLRFEEVKVWMLNRDHNWIFSFENICDTLGLDADYIRGALLRHGGSRHHPPRRLAHAG